MVTKYPHTSSATTCPGSVLPNMSSATVEAQTDINIITTVIAKYRYNGVKDKT